MKISTLSIWASTIVLTMTLFTSCDRCCDHYGPGYDPYYDGGGNSGDRVVTTMLDGCWRGYTHWFNLWDGHNYTKSEIEFVPQTSTYGRGYWVDYYDSFPSDYYIFNDIEWQVYDGYVDIHFIQENSYVTIYNYTLNNYYFDGYINDNGQKVEFKLDRITGPYLGSWDNYVVYSYSPSVKNVEGSKVTLAEKMTDSLTTTRNEMFQKAVADGELVISRGSSAAK